MTRRVWLAMLLLLAAAGAAWWWWSTRLPAAVFWQGYAEADFVKVAPTQQGLLTAVSVARGDAVAIGTPLFTQDDTADRAARDQAAQLFAQAQAQAVNLQQGAKPTEIAQAEANLADARATLARATADLTRDNALLPSGAVSRQQNDEVRAAFLSAQAKVGASEAALAQARAPLGRVGELQAQSAAVAAAQAARDVSQWRLDQRHVTAPVAGRVADVLARPGETMAAGAPVVSLLPPGNIFVRFFVAETQLAGIHRGDAVALSCDSCPPDLRGVISFISPQAEYTPPLIYSEASQGKLVFMVEARPAAAQATLLNPGQPVQVRPLTRAP